MSSFELTINRGGAGGSGQQSRRQRRTSSNAQKQRSTRMSLESLNRGSGAGGGQPIRRQRSTSSSHAQKKQRSIGSAHLTTSQMNTRMSLVATTPTSRRPKSYTQTLVEQRSKSKRNTPRQKLVYAPTPLALLSTSARKDPTLARNKYQKQKVSPPDDRADFGTARTDQDSPRDGVDDHRDPPQLTIREELAEPEPTIIDIIGDAIVDANDAMVNLVFDNEAVTKAIFPYMGGDYYVPEGRDFPEESSVDFYTGTNNTLSEEGFEATPTSLYATQTIAADASTDAGEETSEKNTAGGEEKPEKKTGKLGILMKRQKKVKKDKNSMSETVQAVYAEPEEAETRGLSQEAVALLSIYDKSEGVVANLEPEIDDRNNINVGEQVNDESTIVEGHDLEVEMLGDRNVLALGIGAYAVCGRDDNTIVSSDQREFTLQDYSNPAKQMKPIHESDGSSTIISKQRDQTVKDRATVANKGEQKEELRQKKLATLRRLKVRNLQAAKKALDAQESKSEQASQAKPDLADEITIVSSLQQECTLEDYSNQKKQLHTDTEEPSLQDDNTVLTSENREYTLDDYSKPTLLQRISSFKLVQSNAAASTNKSGVESKASIISKALRKVLTSSKRNVGNEVALKEDVNVSSSQDGGKDKSDKKELRKEVDNKKETNEEEEVDTDDLLAAFNTDALILKSFEVDDGISMQSSISMATDLRSDGPERQRQRSHPRARRRFSKLKRYNEEESKYSDENSRSSAEENSKLSGEDSIDTEEDSIGVEESFTEEGERLHCCAPSSHAPMSAIIDFFSLNSCRFEHYVVGKIFGSILI